MKETVRRSWLVPLIIAATSPLAAQVAVDELIRTDPNYRGFKPVEQLKKVDSGNGSSHVGVIVRHRGSAIARTEIRVLTRRFGAIQEAAVFHFVNVGLLHWSIDERELRISHINHKKAKMEDIAVLQLNVILMGRPGDSR